MIRSRRLDGPPLAQHSVPAWKLALPVLVVLVATTVAVGIVTLDRSSRTPLVGAGHAVAGSKAPSFTSWDLGGKQVSLSDFDGKPLLITFWATWCTACRDELPALERIRDAYKAAGFTVLAVDYRETNTARMTQYFGALRVNLEALIDPNGAIASAYGVDVGLPVNVWLDRHQVVSQIMIGEKPEADLAAAAAKVVGTAQS